MVTITGIVKLLETTKPTASKVVHLLESAGILVEPSGKRRDRELARERVTPGAPADRPQPGTLARVDERVLQDTRRAAPAAAVALASLVIEAPLARAAAVALALLGMPGRLAEDRVNPDVQVALRLEDSPAVSHEIAQPRPR